MGHLGVALSAFTLDNERKTIMDIPPNNDNTYANAVEAATKYALEKISSSKYGSVILCWSEFKHSVAREVAERFIQKGYHARDIQHMRGDGPSWFWYGIEISKTPCDPDCGRYAKTSWDILG